MVDEKTKALVREIKRHRPINVTELIDNCIHTKDFQPMYDIDYKCYYGGDLTLSNMGITKLPNNFTIKGKLNCNNNDLNMLPTNLTVEGRLDCTSNNIKSFPMNMEASGCAMGI